MGHHLNCILDKTASLQPIGMSLCRQQQTQLSFSTCKISTLRSFSLYYTTRWRHFCWQNPSTSSLCLWYTQVWISPARHYFRVRKNISNFHILCYSEGTEKQDPLLFGWDIPLRNWGPCVSPVQFRNLRGNVELSTTPSFDSYHQLRWECCQVQRLSWYHHILEHCAS